MGPHAAETIADEEIRDGRLLLVRRAAESARIRGGTGGAVALQCVFHPAPGARFLSARLTLRLIEPAEVRIVDLQPRLRSGEPVKVTVNREGSLEFSYGAAKAEVGRSREREYELVPCAIQGSGEQTRLARWDFTEDPDRKNGIVREQTLAITLSVAGPIRAMVNLSARLARPGLRGKWDALRDLVLGGPLGKREFPIDFEIPLPSRSAASGFFHLAND